MAVDPFQDALAGFRRWASTTDRTLSAAPERVAAELRTVFELMQDYMGISSPAKLTADHLHDLLLGVYPRKVAFLAGGPDDLAVTIPAMRDLTAYLAGTGTLSAASARAMREELDRIEPHFASAMSDPGNWGPAGAAVHAMHQDGVDLTDQATIDAWIAAQNASDALEHLTLGFDDSNEEQFGWNDVNLKEHFGVPDPAEPIRLPAAAQLAALAVAAPLLADLHDLTRKVRKAPVDNAAVEPLLAHLAMQCELVDCDGDKLIDGPLSDLLDDLSGEQAVYAWDDIFTQVVDTTLQAVDSSQFRPGQTLDLAGHGISLVVDLYLGGKAGVPVAELSQSVKSAATAELQPPDAERKWAQWTTAHGDPAQILLSKLERLCAVTVADGVARLEPLALSAVVDNLQEYGAELTVLPPAAEMTAADVVWLSRFAAEDDFTADFDAWLAGRAPADAARELLAFAAGRDADTQNRIAALAITARLGDAAEPAWRDALAAPQLSWHAKAALLAMAPEGSPDPVPAQLTRTTEDLAWFIADSYAQRAPLIGRNERITLDIAELAGGNWNVTAEALFDAIARLDHPDAEAALTVIGRHSDDKKTAKAARTAAHKAASRRASRRG